MLCALNTYKFFFLSKTKQNNSQSQTPCINVGKACDLTGPQSPIYGEEGLDLFTHQTPCSLATATPVTMCVSFRAPPLKVPGAVMP